jgi:hypothetical protein
MKRAPGNPEIERQLSLSRRHFLRGLGACIALPAFESIRPLTAAVSSSKAATAPVRMAFVYFPNGAIPGAWWPKGEGSDFEISRTLEALDASRKHIQVLGGLDHLNATAGNDGGGDHARANGTFLTGVRMKKSATDIRAGISIDQAVANKIGHLTRFPSLELTCDSLRRTGACDSGYSCAYQYNLSWSSDTTPMTPEGNPRLIFERLFGEGAAGQRAANLKKRQDEQRSLLDFVLEDARQMQKRLTSRDKDKLDQYLTGVRDIEKRIQKAEQFGKVNDPGVETPTGIPNDHEEYVQLTYDMLVLAFQSDSTRVATMLLAHDGSNRPFPEIGVTEGHHDLSHHQERAEWVKKVSEIDRWYATQFAKFLKKLEATKDVDGQSLLHNSMIVYGGGNADGNRHTHSNLPIVLAGAGGGSLTPGRFVKHNAKPASNLFLSLADRMGVKGLERFGDSTGRLSNV